MITLVTGATRSGKSEWAELLAQRSQKSIIYIATASSKVDDPEWQNRLDDHRDRRPYDWQTWEVPIALAAALESAEASSYVLVDALGTWLANVLEQDQTTWQKTEQELIAAIKACEADITLVSEEVGWGVVPAYELGRRFRDRLGSLSRKIGVIADVVYLVTGGYAVDLTQIGERLPF
ncbi:bifunctional adenosylcobinamide kinase/adenosylcobinamide-phosphate guanylyltransferase [Tumidithrix elongata RA019]|uniref:Adenosylcobinamide kinase n=1 Tax=Tumidithrix elongata BACA0141 TaxID=2716417 RepID=A0AAW9PUH1_9CYAN|nr:bifunctional adenosylcobinamide kinase/adenosylcobinamide-phosphate guanylyltransferase [Tumidithrix elongata RA019]